MDSYPIELITHLHPLLVVSGLTDESYQLASTGDSVPFTPNACGQALSRSYPAVNLPIKDEITQLFQERSHTDKIWDDLAFKASRRSVNHLLSITNAGNDYTLSACKSQMVDPGAHSMITTAEVIYPTGDQFSPLSPLNPLSSLSPNGLINAEWVTKYMRYNPATVVSFYELPQSRLADSNKTEILDEALARDINALRIQLQNRNIRLIVIIVTEVAPNPYYHINERLALLRRLTTLSPKTGLLLCPQMTNLVELETFIENICQIAYTQSVDFYTNVAKRLRRKMSKTPNMSVVGEGENTNSNLLSPLGWTVRYEYKLAVLNELKQDIDACVKSYETVYETLVEYFDELSPDSETRWVSARVLLDSIAFKIYKMYLYLSHPNVAYKKFNTHLKVVTDICKFKGVLSGPLTNSHQLWMSVQYEIIAQILDASPESIVPLNQSFYGLGGFEDTNLTPMDYLPRPGFLYLSAYESLKRLNLDAPDSSPQDPYLAVGSLSPTMVSDRCIALLYLSHANFTKGAKQDRNLGYVGLELANSYFDRGDFSNALIYYKTCVRFYLKEKWNPVLAFAVDRLLESAREVGDVAAYVTYLLSYYGSGNTHHGELSESVEKMIENFPHSDDDKVVEIEELDNEGFMSFSSRYNFGIMACPVGTTVSSQLIIQPNFSSHLNNGLTLSSIEAIFEGGMATIKISHDPELPNKNFNDLGGHLVFQKREDGTVVYQGSSNLTYDNNEGSKVFEITQPVKLIGEIRCQKVVLTFQLGGVPIKLALRVPQFNPGGVFDWAMASKNNSLRFKQRRNFTSSKLKILPRPARIKTTVKIPASVCAGETIVAKVSISNDEDEAISLNMGAKLKRSDTGDKIPFVWSLSGNHVLEVHSFEARSTRMFDFQITVPTLKEVSATGTAAPTETPPDSSSSSLATPALAFEFLSKYYLASDDETAITDGMSTTVPIMNPFDISLLVEPRAHTGSWPSAFILTSATSHCHTPLIMRRWQLDARLSFVGDGEVEIVDETVTLTEKGDARCWLVDGDDDENKNSKKTMTEDAGVMITNNGKHRSKTYLFDTSRGQNVDSRSVPLEAQYSVRWRRSGSSDATVNQYFGSVLRLNLPLIEPRVICSRVRESASKNTELDNSNAIVCNDLIKAVTKLRYYIENPTHHILTFSVTMVPAEDFAFQGPQMTSIRLLPFTRFELNYDIYPLVSKGESVWCRLPHLRVYDTVYQKTLSLLSADREVKSDKRHLFLKC